MEVAIGILVALLIVVGLVGTIGMTGPDAQPDAGYLASGKRAEARATVGLLVMRILSGFLFIVYIAIGVVVAEANDYLTGIDSIESILSAALAILLWPLVLLDVDLKIGEGTIDERPDDGGSGQGGSGGGGSGG